MMSNPDRLSRMRRSLELALNHEWPQLNKATRMLARLPCHPITARSTHPSLPVIATVATDGGENRLNLEPIRMDILRVADSNGHVYFEEFIAQSLQPDEILRFFFQSNNQLQAFIKELDFTWEDLLPKTDYQRGNLVSMLRELMEWAALVDLAKQSRSRLLIRDGLLRSILLNEKVFQRLAEKLEELTNRNGHLLAGVAKRSKVLNYLSMALSLNESFTEGLPSYAPIPAELEREAAPAQYRWVGSRAMGWLCIAKLDQGENVPLLPVDISVWHRHQVDEIMFLLHQSARGSFPMRGYPMALAQAHQHARIGGLEMQWLTQILLEQLAERDPAAGRQARLLMLFGKELSERIQDEA
jgi:hypothetical protein